MESFFMNHCDIRLPVPVHRQMALSSHQTDDQRRRVNVQNNVSMAYAILKSDMHKEVHSIALDYIHSITPECDEKE